MAKVGPNAVNLAIAEMIGQLLTFTTHPNVCDIANYWCWALIIAVLVLRSGYHICDKLSGCYCSHGVSQARGYAAAETKGMECPIVQSLCSSP